MSAAPEGRSIDGHERPPRGRRVDAGWALRPSRSLRAGGSREACQPLRPLESLRPRGSCGSCGSCGPLRSLGTGRLCAPISPCGPVGPGAPVAPCAPSSPCGPAGPGGPSAPWAPVASVEPVAPCGPSLFQSTYDSSRRQEFGPLTILGEPEALTHASMVFESCVAEATPPKTAAARDADATTVEVAPVLAAEATAVALFLRSDEQPVPASEVVVEGARRRPGLGEDLVDREPVSASFGEHRDRSVEQGSSRGVGLTRACHGSSRQGGRKTEANILHARSSRRCQANRPAFVGGSRPWKRGWSHGNRTDAWCADDEAVHTE